MTEKSINPLKNAKQEFTQLMKSLNSLEQQCLFTFILEKWDPMMKDVTDDPDKEERDSDEDVMEDPMFILDEIVNDIKKKIPFEAILSSENITTPKTGEYSDCYPNVTIHIDGFLYTDDEINDLVDTGKIQRYYCEDCGSKNVKPYIIISHSMPRDALFHIFNTLIPPIKNKTVLDVGSRLGAVLYGAYVFTDAKKIIGVEMNEDFYKLQCDIIQKHKLNKRIEVLHRRIEECPELVKKSDVIVINNAFEFYLSESEQRTVWNFLRGNTQKGTILVTRPPIEVTCKNLQLEIDIKKWITSMQKESNDFSQIEDDELFDVACYVVL